MKIGPFSLDSGQKLTSFRSLRQWEELTLLLCPQSVPRRRRPRVLRPAAPPLPPPGCVSAAAGMFVLEERGPPPQSPDAFQLPPHADLRERTPAHLRRPAGTEADQSEQAKVLNSFVQNTNKTFTSLERSDPLV